jgi:hypothetical protein
MSEPIYDCSKDFIQEFFYFICERHQYTWFAHNAQYDLRYIIELLEEHMENMRIFLRTDSDAFMITLELPEYSNGVRLVIRDSYALFPETLRKFGLVFVPELPKGEIDVAHFNPLDVSHVNYAKRDTELLLKCLQRFYRLVFEQFGCYPAATAASTALRAWQRTLAKSEQYYNTTNYEDFIRSAYYGGLVFLTDTRTHEGAKSYDINSSYPFQMSSHSFPIGNPVNTKRLRLDRPSIYRITVRAPEGVVVPILPVRDRNGICWPSGLFETTVTNVELSFALDRGYRLFTIHEAIYWEETCSPFRDFIEKCKAIRKAYKGTALETVAKLLQNSLYGKFGTKRLRRKILSHFTDDEVFMGEMWGDYLAVDEIDDEMLCLPQWAVFITAHARIHLLGAVYALGVENVLYGDTDSITAKAGYDLPVDLVGSDYGQWKVDKQWATFRARAPKVYAGHTEDGTIRGAIKGVPKSKWVSSQALEAVIAGERKVITYDTLDSFVLFLKGVRRPAYEAHREISDIGNSRTWEVLPDGRVRPRDYADIRKRVSAPQAGQGEADTTASLFGRVA